VPYNLALSERRAVAVKNYLAQKGGVDPGRMTPLGHGKSDPIATNGTPNRRVEINILSD